MPLFEVAIIEHPTEKEAQDGKAERLVFGPKAVIATDSQSAAISAIMAEKDTIQVQHDRMQVLVRPFAS
jgi:hypothetical protein